MMRLEIIGLSIKCRLACLFLIGDTSFGLQFDFKKKLISLTLLIFNYKIEASISLLTSTIYPHFKKNTANSIVGYFQTCNNLFGRTFRCSILHYVTRI